MREMPGPWQEDPKEVGRPILLSMRSHPPGHENEATVPHVSVSPGKPRASS